MAYSSMGAVGASAAPTNECAYDLSEVTVPTQTPYDSQSQHAQPDRHAHTDFLCPPSTEVPLGPPNRSAGIPLTPSILAGVRIVSHPPLRPFSRTAGGGWRVGV